MRIVFDQVRLRGSKTAKCLKCGKKITRSKSFCQTVNPMNRGSDGLPKSRDAIVDELIEERTKWEKQAERCAACL